MKNKHIFILILVISILFSSCKKEVVKTVSTSKSIQLLSFVSEKQVSAGYKVTIKWIDLDSVTNTSYDTRLFDLLNQQTFTTNTTGNRQVVLNDVGESQPYALRIISNPKLDSTKLRFKITTSNVDITIFDRW